MNMKAFIFASAVIGAESGAACTTKFFDKGGTAAGAVDTECDDATNKYVLKDATCGTATCAAGDKTTCCKATSDKCNNAFVKFGETVTGKTACDEGKSYIATDCGAGTCNKDTAAHKSTCCQTQAQCSSKFQDNGGSDTTKTECAASKKLQSTAYCAKGTCDATVDEGTCCKTKKLCSAGYEKKGGTTSGKKKCSKADMTISSTAYCADLTCTAGGTDDSTCCLEKCEDKFILSGTETGKVTCVKSSGNMVSPTALCSSSTCTTNDDAACCVKKTTTTSGNNSSNKSSDARGQFVVTSLVSTAVGIAVILS